jgi:hypothetical protein
MLSFLAPLYLLGALAVIVPILLHLFRRRVDHVVEFPAVRLIPSSPVERQRRRRLRELILLALRITALVLLAGAFARPYFAGSGVGADTPLTVVAVDTSFSVSAPGQFDRARVLATEAATGAPRGDALALVAFAHEATTVVAPTMDRGAVVAALASLAPSASATRYAAVIGRASELLDQRAGRLVLVTDLQRTGWEAGASASLTDDIEVSVRAVQGPGANIAVTAAERRGRRVVAAVHNFDSDTRSVTVTLSVDGVMAGQTKVDVAGESAAEVTFDQGVPERGAAEVAVEDATGYGPDNRRFLVLDPAEAGRIAVLVADPTGLRGGLYVERALGAVDDGRAFAATVVDGRTLSRWAATDLAAFQAVFVLGTRTLERHGRELVASYLMRGGPMLLALGPDVDPGTLRDVVGAELGVFLDVESPASRAMLVVSDARHPVFRPFAEPAAALGDVSVQRFRRLGDAPGRTVLASLSGGAAALAEQRVGAGRLLLFASDLDNQWNRFPLSPAFVPFVAETARYLTAGAKPQAWVLPATPPGLAQVPGVFTVTGGTGAAVEGSSRRVAINVDVRESNPASSSVDEFMALVPRRPRLSTATPLRDAGAMEDQQRLWQIGLLLMLVALAGEGLVGRRAS